MAKLLGTELNGPRVDQYWQHPGEKGDCITVTTTEDVEPAVELNKQLYNEPQGKNDGLKRVARIPGVVLMEICRINKISFRELMLGKTERSQSIMNSFLNDPAFRHFRTAPGRVDVKSKR